MHLYQYVYTRKTHRHTQTFTYTHTHTHTHTALCVPAMEHASFCVNDSRAGKCIRQVLTLRVPGGCADRLQRPIIRVGEERARVATAAMQRLTMQRITMQRLSMQRLRCSLAGAQRRTDSRAGDTPQWLSKTDFQDSWARRPTDRTNSHAYVCLCACVVRV